MEDFRSKYSGEQVEALLDSVANGEAGGGGGGITVESDPIFSASPAASITEEKKVEWDGKYTKPSTGIPKSDLTSDIQTSLDNANSAIQSTSFEGLTNLALVNGFESIQKGTVYALPDDANGDEDGIIATESYVDTVIANAITTVLNTEV